MTMTNFSHPAPKLPALRAGSFDVLNMTGSLGRTFDRARPAPAYSRFNGSDHLICLVGGDASSTHATYADVVASDEAHDMEPTYRARKDGSEGNVSYQPLPHREVADCVRDIWSDMLGSEPVLETYALARQGGVMLGRMIWEDPESDAGGWGCLFRNGHRINGRGSSSTEVAGPSYNMFACTNGLFPREASRYACKHTLNIGDSFPAMVLQHLQEKFGDIQKIKEQRERWANVMVNHDTVGTYLGLLLWREIIGPRQYGAAKRYYKAIAGLSTPRTPEEAAATDHFASQFDGSLLGAYQAASAAIQRSGAQNRAMHQYGGIAHVTDCLAMSGGVVNDTTIPEFSLETVDFE
jgi:hypothetical protein